MPVDPRIQRILDEPLHGPTDLRFKPKRGYALPPGTGPIGETCRSCAHRSPTDSSYRVWTCGAISRFSPDRGTTIALAEAACGRWSRA